MSQPNVRPLEDTAFSNEEVPHDVISLSNIVGVHSTEIRQLKEQAVTYPALQNRLSVVESRTIELKKGQEKLRTLLFSILLTIPTTLGIGVTVQIYLDGKAETRRETHITRGETKRKVYEVKNDKKIIDLSDKVVAIQNEMNQNFKDLTKIIIEQKSP